MNLQTDMFWMITFWVCYIIAFVFVLIHTKIKKEWLKSSAGLFFVYSALSFIIAIATKDPVFEAIGLPVGYEWLGGMALIGFASWQFYLNPLKKKVIGCEKDIGIIKNDLKHINTNLDDFKPYIMKRR